MKAKRTCPRCRLLRDCGVDGQCFKDGEFIYDVAKARAIIAVAPRAPVEIPAAAAYAACAEAEINLRHVAHVDKRFPPIAIQRGRRFVFIDGNHRAAARLFRFLPVKAYLLTPFETRVILSRV